MPMTKKTHESGGMLFSVIGFYLLSSRNLLLSDVNMVLQWLIIYIFCQWASTISDNDHHWASCPHRDFLGFIFYFTIHIGSPILKLLVRCGVSKTSKIYKFFSIFSARHRSWQTHSDLTLFCVVYCLFKIMRGEILQLNAVDTAIASLVLTGISMGVLAHLVLDAITPKGIWLFIPMVINLFMEGNKKPMIEKLVLVPKTEYFSTGGSWEDLVRKFLVVTTYISAMYMGYIILSPYIGYTLEFVG